MNISRRDMCLRPRWDSLILLYKINKRDDYINAFYVNLEHKTSYKGQ